MPRFETTNPSFEPTEPRVAFPQKPANLLKPILLAVLGLTLVSGLAYGVYWYGKKSIPPPAPEVTPHPTTEVSEELLPPKPTRRRGWEVYKGDVYSFKYPKGWFLSKSELGQSKPYVDVANYQVGEKIADIASKAEFNVSVVTDDYSFPSLTAWIEDHNSKVKRGGGGRGAIEVLDAVTVAGLNAVKTKGNVPGVLEPVFSYFVAKDKVIYELGMRMGDPKAIDGLLGNVLNQILSTFRFMVFNCGSDYDCLFEQTSNGNSARVVITEKIDSLSLEEESEVKIEPFGSQYKVIMTVLELKKLGKMQPTTKSIVGSISESCPQIVNNLSSIELASASCIVNTAEEARTLAIDGLSDTAISKYSCKGKLVDEIKRICVRPDFPNFPPGVKKPAVYLYPLQESKVSVAVDLKGIITKSEPNYYKGWEVVAEPSGLINGRYDYLFYEAQLDQLQLPKEGWVVEFKELENWFDSNLGKLGLNEKEISQFKEYWLAELPFTRYYEIKLLEDNFLKENMNLIVDPKPTTIIRRNFYFKPLESKIILEQPNLITPERKGFTVVEWGGLLDK